ncbi:MAG TPA: ATP-binding protein [Candidatus Moranbacteria bacterium]|nr:ATP-binding protein [Candidatus Moranbacteria bacterium]
MNRVLIIITGLPGTGKTTLGRKIATGLNLPLIAKDDFKEILFNSLGFSDRDWSKKIGRASYDLMYGVADSILRAGQSLILESNFDPKFANKIIDELQKKYHFRIFQIRCFTEKDVLFERFKERALSGDRHPGHVDADNLDDFRAMLAREKIGKIEVSGEFVDIDTTDFSKINEQKVIEKIKFFVENN